MSVQRSSSQSNESKAHRGSGQALDRAVSHYPISPEHATRIIRLRDGYSSRSLPRGFAFQGGVFFFLRRPLRFAWWPWTALLFLRAIPLPTDVAGRPHRGGGGCCCKLDIRAVDQIRIAMLLRFNETAHT